MTKHIHVKVVTWRVRIEPGGFAHAELHYDGYDGRRLSLLGESDLFFGGERVVATEIGVYPSRSKQATEVDCSGFAKLWPAEHNQSELLGVSIDLPRVLWEELWQRSLNPPPNVWVGFTIVGADAGVVGTEFPIGKHLPILSPYVSLNSD